MLPCSNSLPMSHKPAVRIALSHRKGPHICQQECTYGFQHNPDIDLSDKRRNELKINTCLQLGKGLTAKFHSSVWP